MLIWNVSLLNSAQNTVSVSSLRGSTEVGWHCHRGRFEMPRGSATINPDLSVRKACGLLPLWLTILFWGQARNVFGRCWQTLVCYQVALMDFNDDYRDEYDVDGYDVNCIC